MFQCYPFFPFLCFSCFIHSKGTGSAAFIGLSWTILLVPAVFSAPEKREGQIWKKMVSQSFRILKQKLHLGLGFKKIDLPIHVDLNFKHPISTHKIIGSTF